jgi:hypothetical protein
VTEQDLRNCAKEMQDSVIGVQAIVDGVSVKDLHKYRIQSPLFNFTLGRNNILGLPAQTTTKAVSDGNWVFLKPLPVGKHVIYFKGILRVSMILLIPVDQIAIILSQDLMAGIPQ